MSVVFTIQALLFIVLYSLLILAFFAGWLLTKKYHATPGTPETHVSILIPCRNEAENIAELNDHLN
ncbi:MAG: hypothetical protein NTV01_21210, partial [Bacteroidia bacterium]|nr:hypothetical protein [Bacteroidia bacterium]